MPFPLLPTYTAPEVSWISPQRLKALGFSLVMLDFDNTLVPYTTSIPTEKVKNWLEELKASGLQVCVVSNSHNNRVKLFCKQYGIDCITGAKKPFSKGINQCLARYETPKEKAVLVGDQIYTDTLGGGASGVKTVLVPSIHNHTWYLKLRHIAEIPFILLAKNRRLEK